MTVKEVVIDALATKPCRALLTLLENNRIGTIALNQVSYPRCVFKSFEEGCRAAKRVSYAGHDHPDYLRFQAGLARNGSPEGGHDPPASLGFEGGLAKKSLFFFLFFGKGVRFCPFQI